MTRTVFYSFHYKRDVMRVQLVRQINALAGQPLLNAQDWESVRQRGPAAIESWIDDQMSYKRAVVVLIGQETASRPWVRYEINRAWALDKPLVGVRIHGLSSVGTIDRAGNDPFVQSDAYGIPVFDPTVTGPFGQIDSSATYRYLSDNLDSWASQGVRRSDG